METNYWTRLLTSRPSRRRLIGATGAVTLSAAFLAACGGGGDDDRADIGDGDQNGLLKSPEDTTARARRGGTLTHASNYDISSFDPRLAVPQLNEPYGNAMSKLFALEPGHLSPPDGSMTGELAESIEYAPDGLTATVRLRPNLKWHPIAPVNARTLDADDVRYSWQIFSEGATFRDIMINSLNPLGPVDAFEVTDDRTITFRLAFPAQIEALLGFSVSGGYWMLPKEAEGSYDPRNTLIGLGPFYMDQHEPSVRFVYRRFEDHWDADNRAYVDQINQVILPESAARLSQFEAGNIFFTSNGASIPTQEEVLPTISSTPELSLYQDDFADGFQFIMFGYQPPDGSPSPWLDERVRQAFSMSIDRDTFLEVRNNAERFQAAGLPFDYRWHSALAAGAYEGWWLDPKSSEFGPAARYLQYDVAEARALLSAAGYPNGIEGTSNVAGGNAYGMAEQDQEVMVGMAAEAGFRFNTNVRTFQTDYIPNIRDAGGKFEGWTLRGSATGLMADLMARLIAEFHSGGSIFATVGFDAAGRGDASGDPHLDAELERALKERDVETKRSIVHDLQRYLAEKQYTGRHPGTARLFRVSWPALNNVNVFRGAHQQQNHRFWLDRTKAPFNET